MKKFTKLVVTFTLVSITFTGCKEAKEKLGAEATTAEKDELTTEVNSKMKVDEAKITTTVLNANLATEEDLIENGISADLVRKILEKRPFLSMNDLDALVDSSGEGLYKKIFVPLNLNTTAKADFKIIPGVGDRMAHEFEEYRPYISIAQFRREMGKYVDDTEVARYENYVFVPIDLNTASEEAIMALPGVGKRIAHEFEEYRPYTSMEQFRKEIGKYVDDNELARLERLVYLKK